MAKTNRGPIGFGNNFPELDLDTLSLDQNIPRSIIGISDAHGASVFNRKPVPASVFIETETGFAATIYFDINSFLLDNRNFEGLLQVKKYIQLHSYEIMAIDIEGHTSTTGNPTFNFELSKKRIESVFNLLQLNDKTFMVRKKPYGPTKLAMAENGKGAALEYQRSKNRRAEIFGYKQLSSEKDKPTIDLFPKEVLQKLADEDLMRYLLRLPNLEAEKPKIILEEYVKRIFDKIYDPTVGKLEKPIMESKIGDVLKFFGVSELKGPIKDKAIDSLYNLVDQSNLDPDKKNMVKAILKGGMKQNLNK